jgi:Cu2+-exporting ATPase
VELAAALAAQSLHPASRALVNAWNAQFRAPPSWELLEATERPGQGIEGRLRRKGGIGAGARSLRLGSAAFCGVQALQSPAAQVHLSDDGDWIASFILAEDLRADAAGTVASLAGQGLAVQLLSGDRDAAAQEVAAQAGIPDARGACMPEEKLRVLQAQQAAGHRMAMVGDGLNDGPVIAQANASFAFGSAVPLARARADFIVMGGELAVIPKTIAQARRTLRVVRQNLWWAAGYNALCVPLALGGWLPPWLAGLGMAGSSLVVVLNAARLARQPVWTSSSS